MRKRKGSEPERVGLRESIASTVNLSKEVILNVPRIVLIGDSELTIENYKGIVEYTAEKIILEAKPRRIRIDGTTLEVKSITEEMLFVTGNIRNIGYLKGEH